MAYSLNTAVLATSLAQELGCQLHGENRPITNVGSFSDAGDGYLTFCKSEHAVVIPEGAVVIGPIGLWPRGPLDKFTLIVSDHPRLSFIRALQSLGASPGFLRDLTPPVIHRSAVIGNNVVIEPNCFIGQDVVIEHNVIIYSGTSIGANSRINAGAVIGRDGFGFERDESGRLQKFVHLGGVSIGRNVEIGCNACISRGALGTTTIEDGVKIDALVYIAHNCHIEADAIIIASAEVSGGVRIGRGAWIGPNASIMQKVVIGADSLVGLGAVVVKDVPEGSVVAGNPAKFFRKV